jgi:hypothetical protein
MIVVQDLDLYALEDKRRLAFRPWKANSYTEINSDEQQIIRPSPPLRNSLQYGIINTI